MKEVVHEAAEILGNFLRKDFENLVGPAAPIINRVRNRYIMEILIKLTRDAKQIEVQKKVISNTINLLRSEKRFRSVMVIPDVDPF